ncbi:MULTISPECIES: helix-turn-helix domain-containing protein [Paenibacillus]|uniref:helix-turn-helix domain-containing protein n=1 Tax=Paenibacillus TaxID=44249 RepID=UPI0022B8912F|nr:AraC family transcriptional regulator [Paenibacillus caseinilyticus]MCZ8518496.1 AraC family transcriptional regulator [Paenibacillus caseinilyticus]
MNDVYSQKYTLEDESFAIQYMNYKGYYAMPRRHLHSYYEIFYLLGGERVYFINDTVYTARQGDLVIVNPHDLHHTSSSDVPGFERMLINFTPEFALPLYAAGTASELLPFAQGSKLLRLPLKEQTAVEGLIRQMYTECAEAQAGHETCVKAALAQLLVRIHRDYLRESLSPSPPQYTHPMHGKISEIAAYLARHYYEELTLDGVASRFFISPSYLSRVFKKITGYHFREYLLQIRVKEAQRRLRETRDKTISIAEQTGFRHISHFNTTFKKIVGLPPLQYRKHQQELREPKAPRG